MQHNASFRVGHKEISQEYVGGISMGPGIVIAFVAAPNKATKREHGLNTLPRDSCPRLFRYPGSLVPFLGRGCA